MTAGHKTKKKKDKQRGEFLIFLYGFQLTDPYLAKPHGQAPATVSAVYIDTTCQFCVWQVAGGRRVVSCGFVGVTRAQATEHQGPAKDAGRQPK